MAAKKATAKKKSSARSKTTRKAGSSRGTPRAKTAKKKTAKKAKIAKKTTRTSKKAAKPSPKAATAKKSSTVKSASKKTTKKKAIAKVPEPKPARKVKPKPIKTPFSRKELNQFRQQLLGLRDTMTGQISALKNESLNRRDKVITEEDGTEAFDRDFALNLASSEQDAVFEIDEALRRIEQRTFGICEISGQPINRERLDAIPYARLSVRAQEQREKGMGRARMKSDRGLLGIERIDSLSMAGSD